MSGSAAPRGPNGTGRRVNLLAGAPARHAPTSPRAGRAPFAASPILARCDVALDAEHRARDIAANARPPSGAGCSGVW
jgi:hypothetical protein